MRLLRFAAALIFLSAEHPAYSRAIDWAPALDDPNWKVAYASGPPAAPRFCLQKSIGRKNSNRAGSRWVFGTGTGTSCEESFIADLSRKIIFLGMDGVTSIDQTHYCGVRLTPGYDPCHSSFFDALPGADRSYRRMNPGRIRAALAEARAPAALEGMIQATAVEERRAAAATAVAAAAAADAARAKELEHYRSRFQSLKSAGEFRLFISDYTANDPDGLLASAKARLADLQRRDFAEAKTEEQLAEFISNYNELDPAGLVAQADAKFLKMRGARIAQERRDQAIRNIRSCRSSIQIARAGLANQERIKAISGVYDKVAVYNAASMIVACEAQITQAYKDYRAAGGSAVIETLR